MALDLTSFNLKGKNAKGFVGKALFSGKMFGGSTPYITFLPNVDSSTDVTTMSTPSNMLTAYGCELPTGGNPVLKTRLVSPSRFTYSAQICGDQLEQVINQIDVTSGQAEAAIAAYFIKDASKLIDEVIWKGDTLTSGYLDVIDGFLKLMAADTDVVKVTATTLTSANILTEIQKVVAAMDSAIMDKEDIKIFAPVSVKHFLAAVQTINTVFALTYQDGKYFYMGYEIVFLQAMPANKMVLASASNLYLGSNLESDRLAVNVVNHYQTENADKVSFRIDFSLGVQYAFGSEVVLYA